MDLETLTKALGVSGFEEEVRRRILDAVGGAEVDEFGNVVVRGSKVAFVAHMDEVGLLVTNIEEDGRLKFRKVGGIDDKILPGSSVVLYGDGLRVEGVIGIAPPHFQQQQQQISWQELFIDIGVSSRQEAEALGVSPMTPAAFSRRYAEVGKYVSATALDDRAGCWALIEAYKRGAPGTFVWSVQEEVGLMGARAIANHLDVKYAVVVDTTACCHPNWTGGVKPGNGPVLRIFDNYGAYNNKLAKRVLEIAKKRGIPIQIGAGGGGTDAAAFFVTGVPSVAIGILTKYSHSPVEMAHKEDLKHAVELITAIAEELA
ncbi:M42 family metallopeptidase [Pyrobaculum aerophilum]|uniref:Aminopeptidase from family M42 n=2 Tax=Pyrobaculum aerophilum TaxID=13773 RepID=Q8ZX44_PYRAE|nr:M42 family metallopeptidase [Pyrobaculum aerophilum]AAL63505.1 aminopeptidase from family M42 [Pyrobaculum aerophilum str. IM2]MCX8135973.1 M42 family metallopeptidase [Pyrobaculum aerophilum]RFA94617.1 aminopeptidase [Pyrobaculum aerophilum]RFB00280.1 aminopeptidase [Pyrobaculum aerophilum]HII46373.1 M42 family metallopeptidase [Pyrobaculum aerophilum]